MCRLGTSTVFPQEHVSDPPASPVVADTDRPHAHGTRYSFATVYPQKRLLRRSSFLEQTSLSNGLSICLSPEKPIFQLLKGKSFHEIFKCVQKSNC